MRIVLDAMGSDNYPTPDVVGAVLAAREWDDTIILVGREEAIQQELVGEDDIGGFEADRLGIGQVIAGHVDFGLCRAEPGQRGGHGG